MLKESSSTSEKIEEQKGPFSSGRLLADAMKSGVKSIEKRFLHDYAFSIFENKLEESNLILDAPTEDIGDLEKLLMQKAFVRVNGQATFIDALKITSILKSFNDIGEALAHVTNFSNIQLALTNLDIEKQNSRNKSKQAVIRQQEKLISDTVELAKTSGLWQEPKFLKHLALVTEFGFSDQLELQQKIGGHLYSSCLKRNALRESEDLIIRKYSRKTERDLVVLGMPTQTCAEAPTMPLTTIEQNPDNMKEAITNLIDHIANLEGTMSGKSSNEIVIDPIAVYVTL